MNAPKSRHENTLLGMPVPPEIALAVARGRVEGAMRGHLSILRNACMKPPVSDSEAKVVEGAIKWVRKNSDIMDSMSKAEALASIIVLARYRYYDPVEAGLAMRLLCGGNREIVKKIITEFMGKMQGAMRMEDRVMLDNMAGSKHYGLLCAALGDANCIRMVNFWADEAMDADTRTNEGQRIDAMVGDVPTRAVKINIAYSKAAQRLREELDAIRKSQAECG